ncbi:MAG: hypothetical protein ACTHKZ_11085 [Lysobacteraceae bacterium]
MTRAADRQAAMDLARPAGRGGRPAWRRRAARGLRAVLPGLALAAACVAGPAFPAAPAPADGAAFRSAYDGFMDARTASELLPRYLQLARRYDRLFGPARLQAAQLMSMADAQVGRYAAAEAHFQDAFPAGGLPLDCPAAGVDAEPVDAFVARAAPGARVVLLNESHSIIRSRALAYRLLPILRNAGFDHLALEALAPAPGGADAADGGKVLADGALQRRGFPLDDNAGGYYLREPVYGEIVREALSLGFTLVAYEAPQWRSRDEREAGQARALAHLLDAQPSAKVVVLAGYSHVWKTDGWMADQLSRATGAKLLSLDQVAGLRGCRSRGHPGGRAAGGPFVLVRGDGSAWSSRPGAVDATIIDRPAPAGSTAARDWLTLGKARVAAIPVLAGCGDGARCLVSAYYRDEPESAVPADRIVTGVAGRHALYLKPGQYRIVAVTADGRQLRGALEVP